ncbi:MAG: hypothetical protein FRX49_00228 [Trebouxia sp. A1-2]|nr:MAG: hypothetical protein FRX49_00228 [Trebouxia sp. A1-2]
MVCLMSAVVDSAYLRTLQDSGVCTSGIDVTQAPYAADPTGTSDSSSAFNAAIIAAGAAGQTVCLPPGTYTAMADINVNVNGVTISAPSGATIMYGNPSGLQFFIRPQTVGSMALFLTVKAAIVQSSNNKAVGIAQNQCSGNSITGNTASSNGEEGITADNQSNGGQIAGNILTGNAISGGVGNIGIDFASGLSVSGNVIQNSMDGVPGLKTQNNLGPTFGLSISGNTFTDNAGAAIWLFCNSGKCTVGSTVSGNTFSGNATPSDKSALARAVQTFWDDAKQLANAGYAMVAPLTEVNPWQQFSAFPEMNPFRLYSTNVFSWRNLFNKVDFGEGD